MMWLQSIKFENYEFNLSHLKLVFDTNEELENYKSEFIKKKIESGEIEIKEPKKPRKKIVGIRRNIR